MAYDLKSLRAPRAAGNALRALVGVLESTGPGDVLAHKILTDSGTIGFRSAPVSGGPDAVLPVFDHGRELARLDYRGDAGALAASLPDTRNGFRMESAAEFSQAYASGEATPTAIAERVLEIVKATEGHAPPLRLLIAQQPDDLRRQAEAASERHTRGEPLGPLDGVPIAVKDEVDQMGYATTVGTRFLGTEPATYDAEVVLRLRHAGALLLGKANMHEIGIGVTGNNPHHGAVRNPWDLGRATGGSSSASAAAVAAGVCPLTVGADGGGSIRMPASLCGVVGLKATFGRISEHGAAPLCWSLAHVGPIGATAEDVALGYALMAGVDPHDPNTRHQPAPHLEGWDETDALEGVRLGVFWDWLRDAEPGVVRCVEATLEGLVQRGAKLVEIDIPELALLRSVHLVTIVSEMATGHLQYYAEHRKRYGLDTRVNLALARNLTAYDYVHAQRHRVRLCRRFFEVLERDVDAIITPATGRTAPPIADDAVETGESNLVVTDQILRFALPANLTGLPAISFPGGYDEAGLPVGVQAMGRPWSEALLLRLARAAEGFVQRRRPPVHHQLLGV